MEEWLEEAARYVSLAIEAVAILMIAIGSAEAVYRIVPYAVKNAVDAERRAIWLRYANWLTAGLTFQLAADIVSTAIAPTWMQIGHVASIAAIRTFLEFFLDRDVEEQRKIADARRPVEIGH